MKNIKELVVYETVDGEIGAGLEAPDDVECAIIVHRNFTSSQVNNILRNGNMSLPRQIIEGVKSKYL